VVYASPRSLGGRSRWGRFGILLYSDRMIDRFNWTHSTAMSHDQYSWELAKQRQPGHDPKVRVRFQLGIRNRVDGARHSCLTITVMR